MKNIFYKNQKTPPFPKHGLGVVSLLWLVLTLFLLLTNLGCKRQEPQPDPCRDIKPLSADFTISEAPPFNAGEFWTDNDTDTIGTFGAKFTALCENCEYEWKLGSETFTTKSFYRQNFPDSIPIQVSLKVKAKNLPRNYFDCVKDKKLEDEQIRTFVKVIHGRRVFGKYYGVDTDRPLEPYTIEVYEIIYSPLQSVTYVKGMIKPNCNCEIFDSSTTYGFEQSLISLNCIGECMAPIARFNFETNELVTITYYTRTEEDNKVVVSKEPKIFKGRRIQ